MAKPGARERLRAAYRRSEMNMVVPRCWRAIDEVGPRL
jgi:hypothetical protein